MVFRREERKTEHNDEKDTCCPDDHDHDLPDGSGAGLGGGQNPADNRITALWIISTKKKANCAFADTYRNPPDFE